MAAKLFRSVGNLHSIQETNADGYVFKLHYRGTTLICFVACVFLLATRYSTDPIQCVGADRLDHIIDAAKAHCYISQYISPRQSSRRWNNVDVAHPGVETGYDEKTYHKNYFILIPLLLAISGCLFYLPHIIWQGLEGKNLERLLRGPNFLSLGDDTTRKDNIIRYMKITRGGNFIYSFPYLFCEILNLVNVILQLVYMDVIAGGDFTKHGSQIVPMIVDSVGQSVTDGLADSFPRQIKCTQHIFGTSGEIERHDFLCWLHQNILNEKVFIFLWVWLVVLATITSAQLVVKMLMYLSFPVRLGVLEFYGRVTTTEDIKKGVRSLSLGDFFLLELLARNLDSVTFRDVLMQMFGLESLHPTLPVSADSMM